MACTLLETPIGTLQLFADNNGLYRIVFPCSANDIDGAAPPEERPGLLRDAAGQLLQYFSGTRQNFDLPLTPRGTDFQHTVWKCMGHIPYGETRTYGELAAQLGNGNLARAVGGAANKNPLPLVIPCHRVIGASGRLTGFAGGLALKRYLLELEQKKAQIPAAAGI